MFRCILTLSTTTAVMLHALLGCCAHHAHGCQDEQVTIEHAHSHHCHHEHRVSNSVGEGQDSHPHSEHEPCDEADCSFVTTSRADDLSSLLLTDWAPIAIDQSSLTMLIGSIGGESAVERLTGDSLIADPLRVQTQVWLL